MAKDAGGRNLTRPDLAEMAKVNLENKAASAGTRAAQRTQAAQQAGRGSRRI